MKLLTCKFLIHRGKENIALHFEIDAVFTKQLRNCIKISWSKQHECWYCLCSRDNFTQIINVCTATRYEIDYSQLKAGMEMKSTPQVENLPAKESVKTSERAISSAISVPISRMSSANAVEMTRFIRQLHLKSYSPSTIKTYKNELLQFFLILKNRAADSFDSEKVKDYLQYCHQTLKLSEATLHSRINALKFYYEQVLGKDKFFWDIPRPKKPIQLPKVLGEREIGRLFNSIKNLKHKAILFTAYSAGLRVSEVINLKIRDVDSERMQLFIEKGKGKKDRYVGLGILLLDVLRAYMQQAVPRPCIYVFENPAIPGQPYSVRSAQKIFEQAKAKAFVNKKIGIHSLRHSFATHLLEKGIDIRYIKDILGHLSIKTTERYLHVKRETLINIPNMLDELNKSVDLEW